MARRKVAIKARSRSIGYGWLILLAIIGGFGISLWVRYMATPKLTALEKMIAANAPLDHVHTLLSRPDGTLLVGTHYGILQGNGKTWTRLPGPEADIQAMAPGPGGQLMVAAESYGVALYRSDGLQGLHTGKVHALAVDPRDPNRLLASGREAGLLESPDGGRTWVQLASPAGQTTVSMAIDPDGMLYAGTVQGMLLASPDGGRTWNVVGAPGGSITSLSLDPAKPRRLLAAAGGAAIHSDDGGVTWTRLKGTAAGKAWVALAPETNGGGGLWGVTADGYLTRLN